MTRDIGDLNNREDEGGGGFMMNLIQQQQENLLGDSEQQTVDIFVRHVGQQLKREQENRQRRPSLPIDAIELPALNGVVMRRKQQLLQLRYQQQQQQQQSNNNNNDNSIDQELPQPKITPTPPLTTSNSTKIISTSTPTTTMNNRGRPLSICSISSAASSGSSSSANSSASSGVQSSLTRNGSLNYGLEYRKSLYLASIESLNNPQTNLNDNMINHSTQSIEAALKSLSLSSSDQFRDVAATRAAVLAAGAQSRGFTTSSNTTTTISNSTFNQNNVNLYTACTRTNTTNTTTATSSENYQHSFSSMSSLSISSTSSPNATTNNNNINRIPRINRSLHASLRYDKSTADRIHLLANARALINNAQQQKQHQQQQQHQVSLHDVDGFNTNHLHHHHPQLKLRRGSAKLQPSPSSASSHSNSSSLFRDDGFEDDLTSNTSENLSTTTSSSTNNSAHSSNTSTTTTYHHQHNNRPSFQSTKTPGYWDSNLSITQRVITEIIETERTYVDDLEQIVTGYICYLRNVLKQQKQQNIHKSNDLNRMVNTSLSSAASSALDRHDRINSFDYDNTNAVNEIDDDDMDDNDLSLIKENFHNHQDNNNSSYDNCNISNPLIDSQQQSASKEETTKPNQNNNNKLITSTIKSKSATTINNNCNTNTGAIITVNHIKRLFSNLEEIYKFNKDLLFALEECYLNPSAVAECFVENSSGFEVYTHYCTMYPQVVTTLTELMANQESAQLLKERQIELNQSLPLGAYLLKPVQRILKYHLLFQSLIKHTSDDETINEKDRLLISEAFSVMTNIASHINAMKKRHEHAIRVQEVQGLLCGWNGPDLTTLGELILEDTFKLFNKPKSSRHLFLFDNVLLFTKKKRDGSLCYKGHIACSNLMLIEKIEGQPLVFNTVPFDNPKALHALQAKNLDKKRDWCLQMKEVIIKSFEVKIPVHVRDILMGLTNSGSSGTETTSSPSTTTKSSSETARLLKAPNYLEKKRAKQAQQDKRK